MERIGEILKKARINPTNKNLDKSSEAEPEETSENPIARFAKGRSSFTLFSPRGSLIIARLYLAPVFVKKTESTAL